MKNKKINIIILLIAISLVLFFTLKDDFNGVIKSISNVRIDIFIISLIIYFIAIVFRSLSFKIFMNEYYKDFSLIETIKINFIAIMLNGITPFQSGGQPFLLYILKKQGKRIADTTNVVLKDNLSHQIALVFIGLICIMFNIITNKYNFNGLFLIVLIGFIVNFIVLIAIIVAMKSKKLANKIIDYLYKFNFIKKIIKKDKEKIKESIKYFYDSFKELKKNKNKFIMAIICNFLNIIILYTIPYFVFKSLGCEISIISSIIMTAFVMLIGNFIPIPGATGGIEYGFYKFFGIFRSGAVLSSALLIWRFITYLFGILLGFIFLMIRKDVDKK